MFLRRRRLIAATGLAAASSALPRVAIGQADRRPSITIAVQQIANSASLEPLREQSNVGARTFSFIFETLIMQNLLGQLEAGAGPGRELEAPRRAHRRARAAQGREVPQRRRDDRRRRGLHLRPRAHVRPRLRHHQHQDAVHLACWSAIRSRARSCRRKCRPSPSACSRRWRRSRRSTSTRCASPTARPTSRWRAASAGCGSDIISAAPTRRPRPGSTGRARRSRPAPTRCASSWSTSR